MNSESLDQNNIIAPTQSNQDFIEKLRGVFPILADCPNRLTHIEEKFLLALIQRVTVASLFQAPVSFGKAGDFRVLRVMFLAPMKFAIQGRSKSLYDEGYYNPFVYSIRPQHRISLEGKEYRIDFLIEVCDKVLLNPYKTTPKKPHLSVAVELDGHDFHEKTKEQAIRDKERDRVFQQAGIKILRYTGSEIFKNVDEVLDDVFMRVFGFMKETIPKPWCGIVPTPKNWKKPEW